MGIKKITDVKLNVKPVFSQLIHRHAYEGPCRLGGPDMLTREFDEHSAASKYESFCTDMKTNLPDCVNVLEPVYAEFYDDFIIPDAPIEEIIAQDSNVDFYLFDGFFQQLFAKEVARRTKKPVGIIGMMAGPDGSAYLRAMGQEAYPFIDRSDLEYTLKLLQVRKAIASTHVLLVNKNQAIADSETSNLTHLEEIKNRLGMRTRYANLEDVLESFEEFEEELTPESERIAKELAEGADAIHMDCEKYTPKDVRFYLTVKKLLEKHDCNAFTIPCPEVCATRYLNNNKFLFCLTHSLLKEDGIPSSCAVDMNAMLCISLLTSLTNKAPHMGNVHPFAKDTFEKSVKSSQSNPKALRIVDDILDMDNIVMMFHAVPTRNMHGLDKQDPYEIRNFTHSGFGTTIRYDYNRDRNETLTMIRFDPLAKKVHLVKSKLIAGAGLDTVGCSTGFFSQVKNVKDFFKKQGYVGHHYTWVFGDYTEEIKDLMEMLDIEVMES